MKLFKITLLALLLYTARVNAQNHSADTAKSSKYITGSVKVSGLVDNQLDLSITDLKQMKAVQVNNFDVIGKGGVVKSHLASFKGVLLTDVLTKAGLPVKALKESGSLYIVISAADGFKVVFSWAELFNTTLGEHVFIAYEENGKPIEKEGKLVLFSTVDKINGMRHVKWLKEINVKKAE
jgi:DMSO/TMAO reductase YedYZ molybdopterin-dependent catalytic subunit